MFVFFSSFITDDVKRGFITKFKIQRNMAGLAVVNNAVRSVQTVEEYIKVGMDICNEVALDFLENKPGMICEHQTITTLMTLKKKHFENIVGKGENAGNQLFLPFQLCFIAVPKKNFFFKLHLFCFCKCLQFGPV